MENNTFYNVSLSGAIVHFKEGDQDTNSILIMSDNRFELIVSYHEVPILDFRRQVSLSFTNLDYRMLQRSGSVHIENNTFTDIGVCSIVNTGLI